MPSTTDERLPVRADDRAVGRARRTDDRELRHAHRHWLLGAACVFAGSLAGQLVFAFGGSAIGRFVKSPGWLAASHVVAALVVLGYGVTGLMRV